MEDDGTTPWEARVSGPRTRFERDWMAEADWEQQVYICALLESESFTSEPGNHLRLDGSVHVATLDGDTRSRSRRPWRKCVPAPTCRPLNFVPAWLAKPRQEEKEAARRELAERAAWDVLKG